MCKASQKRAARALSPPIALAPSFSHARPSPPEGSWKPKSGRGAGSRHSRTALGCGRSPSTMSKLVRWEEMGGDPSPNGSELLPASPSTRPGWGRCPRSAPTRSPASRARTRARWQRAAASASSRAAGCAGAPLVSPAGWRLWALGALDDGIRKGSCRGEPRGVRRRRAHHEQGANRSRAHERCDRASCRAARGALAPRQLAVRVVVLGCASRPTVPGQAVRQRLAVARSRAHRASLCCACQLRCFRRVLRAVPSQQQPATAEAPRRQGPCGAVNLVTVRGAIGASGVTRRIRRSGVCADAVLADVLADAQQRQQQEEGVAPTRHHQQQQEGAEALVVRAVGEHHRDRDHARGQRGGGQRRRDLADGRRHSGGRVAAPARALALRMHAASALLWGSCDVCCDDSNHL
eukprot:254136-Prymnesium_polylepis.1